MAVIRPDRTHSHNVPRVTWSRLITSTVVRKLCLRFNSSIKLMSRASLGASAPRPLRVDTQGIVCSPFIEDKILELVLDVGFLSHVGADVPSSGDAVDVDLYLEPITTFLS